MQICIALAQRMHRTEMALRMNLLPNGVQQKVRPLNDAKAIANGANAISEGFLFFVAAALILGETYRGSRKKAEQRDRTEESVNQLQEQIERLATVLGIDLEQLQRISEQDQDAVGDSGDSQAGSSASGSRRGLGGSGVVTEEADPSLVEARLKVYQDRQNEDLKTKQLQAAVSVLLNLALSKKWIQGPEALELESILGNKQPSSPSTQISQDTSARLSATATLSSPSDETPSLQPSIIQQVALERAKALAREVQGEADASSQQIDASLANLLAQRGQTAPS